MNIKTEVVQCLEGLWLDESANFEHCTRCELCQIEYDDPEPGLHSKECLAGNYEECPPIKAALDAATKALEMI
jgi:hypothetical protein